MYQITCELFRLSKIKVQNKTRKKTQNKREILASKHFTKCCLRCDYEQMDLKSINDALVLLEALDAKGDVFFTKL